METGRHGVESFEIVRRRLFETPGERAEVEGISRQFSDFLPPACPEVSGRNPVQ
ncbi:MAG: hypothetical protein AAES65_00880 [Candidatus Thiodiazotropha sp. (ex. Lucinoma kazani)]